MNYYSATILKQWIIYVGNIDGSQNNYAEWKKPDIKKIYKIYTIWFHLHKILESENVQWLEKDQWLPGYGIEMK